MDYSVITVLVTGAGAPGIAGTLYALRENPDKQPMRLIVTDIQSNPIGRYMADGFYCLPKPESKEYISELNKIIELEKVDAVIPQTTREIMTLSKQKKEVVAPIVVSDFPALETANDKYLLLEACKLTQVPHPNFFLTKTTAELKTAAVTLGYPKQKVIVKPRLSNGQRGVRLLTEEIQTVAQFLGEKPSGMETDLNSLIQVLENGTCPELLVTEYLPGEEYSIDTFRNNKSTLSIPRHRQSIRSGISFDTKIEMRDDLIRYSHILSEALDLKYCFGFQFKLDAQHVPKILESNPRVQGTMVASTFAGFNMIYASLREALGHPVSLDHIHIQNGAEFRRYWGGFGLNGTNYLGRI